MLLFQHLGRDNYYGVIVDIDAQSKRGLLQVSEIDRNENNIIVRLKKKK